MIRLLPGHEGRRIPRRKKLRIKNRRICLLGQERDLCRGWKDCRGPVLCWKSAATFRGYRNDGKGLAARQDFEKESTRRERNFRI